MKRLTLEMLNYMEQREFTAKLGWIFEHSPWVAEQAWHAAPFSSLTELHQVMVQVVHEASVVQQFRLLKAHPDLASRISMSEASVQEQQGAGLDQLTPEEYEQFTACNAAYIERFAFPFIKAVRGHNKASILSSMRQRLDHSAPEEYEQALKEVALIAWYRLKDTMDQVVSPPSTHIL